jgi:hypothetical protein
MLANIEEDLTGYLSEYLRDLVNAPGGGSRINWPNKQ